MKVVVDYVMLDSGSHLCPKQEKETGVDGLNVLGDGLGLV